MGYTHYWKKVGAIDEKRYKLALSKIRKLIELHKDNIPAGNTAGGYYSDCLNERLGDCGGDNPVSKADYIDDICINGLGDMSHETFFLPVNGFDLEEFQFCKTARKPYDVIVVACLVILKHYLGNSFKFSSDGDDLELEEGFNLARTVLKSIKPLGYTTIKGKKQYKYQDSY